jgi:Microcystin-dependent protein
MATYYVGQIILFAGHYAPDGFLPCDGRTLNVSSYEALFSLIGYTYGGSNQTFALPDLRSRIPLGKGQGYTFPDTASGPQLTNYALGQKAGAETVVLNTTQIPAHTHTLNTANTAAVTADPTGTLLAQVPSVTAAYVADTAGGPTPTTVQMADQAITSAGGNAAHINVMPTLPLTYIICTMGEYPTPQ